MSTGETEGGMNVYVPKWMTDEDGEKVRETMSRIVHLFRKDDNSIAASVLVYALTNLATGIINAGVEQADDDQEQLINVFTICSGGVALMQDCLQTVVSKMSDDTMTLLGEPEGNA